MIPVDKPSDIPPAELADMEQVRPLIAEGKRVTDPALRQRVHERSEQVRRAMLEGLHGITNVAADLIQEVRDEEGRELVERTRIATPAVSLRAGVVHNPNSFIVVERTTGFALDPVQ